MGLIVPAKRGTSRLRGSAHNGAHFCPMTPSTNRLLAYGCLALSMSLTGSYVALSKPLVAAIPVFLLAWMRFGIAAIAMARWLRKPRDEAPLTPQVKRLVFLESFLGNFLFSICMLYGVGMTSAISAGVIMASIPAVIALMSWVFLRERIAPRMWAAAACAVVGIAVLALTRSGPVADVRTPGGAVAGAQWLGNLLVFGAVLCESAYTVIGKKLTGLLSPKRISSLINLWGLTLMTPFGFYLALGFDFSAVRPGIWLLLVFYALAASVVTVWLWMTGTRRLPAAQGGIFTVMLPISAALVGVLALGESLSWMQVLAFAFALLGILLAWRTGSA